MKRFIDLRGQQTQYRFAWWDTMRAVFENHGGDYAWDTWDEFEESALMDGPWDDEGLARYRGLCPPWAFEEPKEDNDGQPEPITCPLCGSEMVFGIWAIAEVPDTDGEQLIEDAVWFCTPVTGGCAAVVQPGVTVRPDEGRHNDG